MVKYHTYRLVDFLQIYDADVLDIKIEASTGSIVSINTKRMLLAKRSPITVL